MPNFTIKDLTTTLKGVVIRGVKRWPTTFGRRRKWLNETQWWSADDLKKLQFRLLKHIISHVYETVPYYSSVMKSLGIMPDDIQNLEDIAKFPILHRADVESAGDRLFSKGFSKIFLRTAHTGGTTGARLILKRDLWSIGNEHAFVRRQFDWAGIGLSDPCAYMMWRVVAAPGQKIDKPYVYDAVMKELTLSTFHLSEDMVPTYVKAIVDYKIKALVGYPSAAYVLAKSCLEHGIRVPLKAVLTTAETLDSAKKETISKAFECKVYDFYGGSERVCYIQMCEHGSYHIIPEYALTELIRAESPNDDSYRIIATGFWNMAMPFIRYDTGDLVQPGSNTCLCGRGFPTVKKIIGRENKILTTPSGRTLGPTVLECVMENILFAMQKMPVLEGQVIQESRDVMTLEYVPLRGFGQKDADKLKSLIADNFPGDFKVNVRPVEKIGRTASGKALSFVICRSKDKGQL
jgi:phenylacetate-CoA ligase